MTIGRISCRGIPPGGTTVYPSSLTSSWQTVINAGGLIVLDAANITNPDTEIDASLSTNLKNSISRKGFGTTAIVRMGYSNGLTAITSPVIEVFGRTGSDVWMPLKTKSASLTATITTDATNDINIGGFRYTTPDFTSQAWDCGGCDELVAGVSVILAGTGTVDTAFLQIKFF